MAAGGSLADRGSRSPLVRFRSVAQRDGVAPNQDGLSTLESDCEDDARKQNDAAGHLLGRLHRSVRI